MKYLTPTKLINYTKDYDYDITIEQAKVILELLEDTLGSFTANDIVRATDYIMNGEKSRYADYF